MRGLALERQGAEVFLATITGRLLGVGAGVSPALQLLLLWPRGQGGMKGRQKPGCFPSAQESLPRALSLDSFRPWNDLACPGCSMKSPLGVGRSLGLPMGSKAQLPLWL